MKFLVIDGQGGGMGKQIVSALREKYPSDIVIGVGTNGTATHALLKAGANQAATGENAVIVACRSADIIIGPIGIVIADALFGEISPAMAAAVGQSRAKRILVPVNHCDSFVAGASDVPLAAYIRSAIGIVENIREDTN